MIDRKALLDGLRPLMGRLERDLAERSESAPHVAETLKREHDEARKAGRTAQTFSEWRNDYATQQAAAWIVSSVFVRFLEDNRLIDPPRIAGPGDRLQEARDQHELYFRVHPTETDREYLLHVFCEVGQLPGGREIFGPHNPVFELPQWLSGDAAGEILKFLQRIHADTGTLVHDFTDPAWDTRFLGDLYQDLSEAARKKFALLQTPDFIEAFILDRTLEPALDEFGLDAPPVKNDLGQEITGPGFRMLDPACGSGHLVLGAFRRILARWQRREPGTLVRELVQRALDSVHGVDLNPFAVAIARFRLLVAALQACGIQRLKDAPAFHFNLAAGDSLLHNAPGDDQQVLGFDPLAHHYQSEDIEALRHILRPGTYHAVVGNPPYITVKDKALNQLYRDRYVTCHMKYSLAVPFMERIYGLAVQGGFTGQITARSFMKREFGKKLIEEFIPTVDLTHVIDTSGAYIPGHGTPTVILFGRRQPPVTSTLRTVLGIRGEPSTPADPSQGLVWTAILQQIDQPGSQSDFVSAGDLPRASFHAHPWSIGGGGAAELKELLDSGAATTVARVTTEIGFFAVTGEDEAFVAPRGYFSRIGASEDGVRQFSVGDNIRDWAIEPEHSALFPYDSKCNAWLDTSLYEHMWCLRAPVRATVYFGKLKEERGMQWWEYVILLRSKLRTPLSIVFAFVATDNHFVLDRGGKVFKQSAPIIKLPADASEDDHLALLGLLNSSTACFWMKQAFHDKGGGGIGGGLATEGWEHFFEYESTKARQFPLPAERPIVLPRSLDRFANLLVELTPSKVIDRWAREPAESLRTALRDARSTFEHLRRHMIGLQEELDWQSYRLYGLLAEDLSLPNASDGALVDVDLGQRAFEIVLARRVAGGDEETTWFERHGSTLTTEVPTAWPEDYRRLVERRIEIIETDKSIGLIERPEYKRRWNTESWDQQQARGLRSWLLDRLESYFDFDGRMNDERRPTAKLDVRLHSVSQLADVARHDPKFIEAGQLYTGDPAFDVTKLVAELVEKESVPLLPILRYKPSGLEKRDEWEKTWALQRIEDAVDARTRLPEADSQYLTAKVAERLKREDVGDIPVPPKYGSGDFWQSHYWTLRGKLDVPKERWVSFPHCEGPDGTLMLAWAGYDHLQLAQAISRWYVDIQERLGGREDARLVPLLAGLIELLPWLKQWHNDLDPEFGVRMGDYFEGFIQEEARNLGMTLEEVGSWQPTPQTGRRRSPTR